MLGQARWISSSCDCVHSTHVCTNARTFCCVGQVTAGNLRDAFSLGRISCDWVFSRFSPHKCSCLMASSVGHFLTLQCNISGKNKNISDKYSVMSCSTRKYPPQWHEMSPLSNLQKQRTFHGRTAIDVPTDLWDVPADHCAHIPVVWLLVFCMCLFSGQDPNFFTFRWQLTERVFFLQT